MDFERMLRYCELLEQNNNRGWFHQPENHRLYTEARQDFTSLVDELRFSIADRCSPDLAERLISSRRSISRRIRSDFVCIAAPKPYSRMIFRHF